MATFLDLGLLQFFDVIFAVLLVFALLFAILQKTKAVGNSLGINATIAVAISFMVLLSSNLVKIIKFAVPWFALLIIFLILIILLFQIFGVTDVSSAVKDTTVQWTLIGLSIVIVVAAVGNVFGQQLLESGVGGQPVEGAEAGVATGSFQQNIYATIFHPKVLGMVVLFVIAIFAVTLLSGSSQ